MYYCSNCGKEIPDNENFCGFCGTRVTAGPKDSENKNTDTAKESAKVNNTLSKLKNKKVLIPAVAAVVALVIAGVLLFTFTVGSIGVAFLLGEKSTPVKDFEYEMVAGQIVITGYTGSDLKIVIPKKINKRPVVIIGEDAFAEYDMTHVTIPDTVTTIESGAFSDCMCLTSVKFSDSLVYIGSSAFRGCYELKKISFPSSLESIGNHAFYDCTSLEKISFPKGLKRIELSAFEGCAVKEVKLPDKLEYLEANAFAECENLKELKIPDNTDIEISLEESGGWYSSDYWYFTSPIGSASVYDYYDSSESECFDTVLVVKHNSYAYKQVEPYLDRFIEVEVKYW